MDDFVLQMKCLLTDIRNRENYVCKQMIGLPDGKISVNYNRGKKVIVLSNGVSHGRKRHYVTNDTQLQIDCARKSVLEKELAYLEACEKGVLLAISTAEKTECIDRMRFCIERYPWMSDEMLQAACKDDSDLDEWMAASYQQSDYYAEDRTLYTSRGLAVRSKSELLIVEQFYKYEIAFRYEQVFYAEGGTILNPDFTIRKPNGDIVIWEHEGLTNNQTYLDWQRKKGILYANNGFVPWKNLIVTYDTADGDIDLRIIVSEIENKLLR